jgi:hypothetical protein
MKEVFIISEYTNKAGENKSFWYKVGTSFENKDGSISFNLCTMPGVRLQIRDKKEKQEYQQEENRNNDMDAPF